MLKAAVLIPTLTLIMKIATFNKTCRLLKNNP